MNLYVYYQVPHAARDEISRLVRAVQRQLSDEAGITGRLMQRVDAPGPRETWMEIYEDVAADFEALLQATIEARGIEALLCSPRHVERFGELA